MIRPKKQSDVILKVQKSIESGRYYFVSHAKIRIQQRKVTRFEVLQVLKNGHHEKKKDEFKDDHNSWNYSIKGKTIDKRLLRIAITFDNAGLLIITVIDLSK